MERIYTDALLEQYANALHLRDRFGTWDKLTKILYRFRKGEIVALCGEAVDSLFLLVEGTMEFLCINEDDEIYLSYKVPADWLFYDVEYVTGGAAATQSNVTKDSYCIAFPIQKNQKLLDLDLAFQRYMVKQLVEKLELRRISTRTRKTRPIRERLASYLLEYEVGEPITSFSEVARVLNCSYRQLKRVTDEFCEQRILEKTSRGTFRLVNKEAMLAFVKNRTPVKGESFARTGQIQFTRE